MLSNDCTVPAKQCFSIECLCDSVRLVLPRQREGGDPGIKERLLRHVQYQVHDRGNYEVSRWLLFGKCNPWESPHEPEEGDSDDYRL
jgi:hypothetical protein